MIPAVHAVPGGRPIGIFSSSPARAERLARELSLERAYPSLDALLSDPAIEAVYVSTTNDLHAPRTIAAAQAGKHVLCEKPLAVSLQDAIRMHDECRAAGVVLGTNHHYRGAAVMRSMRELVGQGAVGEILAARVVDATVLPESMRTWRIDSPEAGAGVTLDLTVHEADIMRFLLDDEILEVTALAANHGFAQNTIEDSIMGVMRTRREALVSFHSSFTTPHAGALIEIHGRDGSLIGEDCLSIEPIGSLVLRRSDTVRSIAVSKQQPLYEHAIARFNEAVRGLGHPVASGADGIASLAVALAALESARTSRTIRVQDGTEL